MKLYLVFDVFYGECSIVGIYTTIEKAEKACGLNSAIKEIQADTVINLDL